MRYASKAEKREYERANLYKKKSAAKCGICLVQIPKNHHNKINALSSIQQFCLSDNTCHWLVKGQLKYCGCAREYMK